MKLSYPTRNEARGILLSFVSQNPQLSLSIREICSYVVLCYQNKHNVSFVTFAFTNALVDMFPTMNVKDENFVDTISRFNKESNDSIDMFFINKVGIKLEEFISKHSAEERNFKVVISNSGALQFNPVWFNNSDKFIHPLLVSYQEFKKSKGMLFQNDDIKQIPIDYSVILCYNHFIQNGFLNKDVCLSIIKTLTNAANECLNITQLKYEDIEYNVFKDLNSPKSIKATFDFIKQL